jgi:hypothetical protein
MTAPALPRAQFIVADRFVVTKINCARRGTLRKLARRVRSLIAVASRNL